MRPSTPIDSAASSDGSDAVRTLGAVLGRSQSPCAVTAGPDHIVVYANAAFRRVVVSDEIGEGVLIRDLVHPEAAVRLGPILDTARADGHGVQESFLGRINGASGSWSCSVWPVRLGAGDEQGLGIGLRRVTHGERSAILQREVTERLLLSALREAEIADIAEAARDRTSFLVDAGRRLGASLDEVTTRETVAGIAMPSVGAWCIVDLIEADGALSRLALVHPNPDKQEMVRALASDWTPRPDDPFGAPLVMRDVQPVVTRVEEGAVEEMLAAAAHTPENLRLLKELVVGPLLTVPLVSHGKLLGAVTFVRGHANRPYNQDDIELAEGLAARSADALDSARLYSSAVALRDHAEATSSSRLRFLGNISHELRTPLNAISGYAELLEEGIHGPTTADQRRALERIRWNQQHLLVLVTDILNFVRLGVGRAAQLVPVQVGPSVDRVLSLLEALAAKKTVRLVNEAVGGDVVVPADPDNLQQILINLVSNAIKFTPAEGTITVGCAVVDGSVRVSVTDTGIGVELDQTEAIFQPFVQLDPTIPGGAGLGLAISRDLARAMGGELGVESVPGRGSCFTLTLPNRPA